MALQLEFKSASPPLSTQSQVAASNQHTAPCYLQHTHTPTHRDNQETKHTEGGSREKAATNTQQKIQLYDHGS